MGKPNGRTVHFRSSSNSITAQPWLAMWLNTGEASHSNEHKSSCGVQHLPALLGCLFRFLLKLLHGFQSYCLLLSPWCRWYHGAPRQQESQWFLFSGSMLELGWGRCPIVAFVAAAGTMHKAHFVLHRPELQVSNNINYGDRRTSPSYSLPYLFRVICLGLFC